MPGFVDHLHEACVGSISEIFDAEPPFTPRVVRGAGVERAALLGADGVMET